MRDFADGFVAVLLPVYLIALGLGAFQVGVLATVALTGSALFTLAIGFFGVRFDRRRVLLAASAVMTATGLAMASTSSYPLLLAIALLGTINPSAGTVSIFVPLEHALLSQTVADEQRTRMFARYSLIGALAAAAGALAAASPETLARFGVAQLDALRGMFVLYALFGVAAGALYARLAPEPQPAPGSTARPASALGPSRAIVLRLAALFCVDSFAGGLAVQSLLALWLFRRFGVSLSAAGLFFFWSGVLGAFSFPVAVWLSQRIGLVRTMAFTHIPANVCLILAAVAPTAEAAFACLTVRAALQQMDVPTRASYVMAVVTPPERAAAASVTSVPRSLASAASPAIAGALFAAGLEAWPLILCGALKIVYDLVLLWAFVHLRPPEEQ